MKRTIVSFEIAEYRRFIEKVDAVITEGLRGTDGLYFGTLIVNLRTPEGIKTQSIEGQFGDNDCVEEYGFRLIEIPSHCGYSR